jgi:eukaryotic-like serine/threonine-protein kinase
MFYRGELIDIAQRLPLLLKDAQERGDLYAVTNLATRVSYINFLVTDRADEGRKTVRQALQEWSRQGFYLQHFFSLVAQTEISLYCGDYRNGWDLLNAQWSELERSLILNIQVLNIESLHLRARSTLAAATVMLDSNRLLKTAERIVAQIEREQMLYGNAFAALIRAGIAATRAKQREAIELLIKAEHDFEQADMALYAIAARRRRGELLGGSVGDELVRIADEWMRAQNIKNPSSMANMLAPGKYEVRS